MFFNKFYKLFLLFFLCFLTFSAFCEQLSELHRLNLEIEKLSSTYQSEVIPGTSINAYRFSNHPEVSGVKLLIVSAPEYYDLSPINSIKKLLEKGEITRFFEHAITCMVIPATNLQGIENYLSTGQIPPKEIGLSVSQNAILDFTRNFHPDFTFFLTPQYDKEVTTINPWEAEFSPDINYSILSKQPTPDFFTSLDQQTRLGSFLLPSNKNTPASTENSVVEKIEKFLSRSGDLSRKLDFYQKDLAQVKVSPEEKWDILKSLREKEEKIQKQAPENMDIAKIQQTEIIKLNQKIQQTENLIEEDIYEKIHQNPEDHIIEDLPLSSDPLVKEFAEAVKESVQATLSTKKKQTDKDLELQEIAENSENAQEFLDNSEDPSGVRVQSVKFDEGGLLVNLHGEMFGSAWPKVRNGAIIGRISPLGDTLLNSSIRVQAQSETAVRYTYTAMDGTYVLRDMPIGEYEMFLYTREYEILSEESSWLKAYVGNGATYRMPDLHVTQRASVSPANSNGGVFSSISSQPLEQVVLYLDDGKYATLTDASGGFLFSGIPAGSYTLHAQLQGYESYSDSITVVSGQTVYHKVYMKPKTAILTGIVQPANYPNLFETDSLVFQVNDIYVTPKFQSNFIYQLEIPSMQSAYKVKITSLYYNDASITFSGPLYDGQAKVIGPINLTRKETSLSVSVYSQQSCTGSVMVVANQNLTANTADFGGGIQATTPLITVPLGTYPFSVYGAAALNPQHQNLINSEFTVFTNTTKIVMVLSE